MAIGQFNCGNYVAKYFYTFAVAKSVFFPLHLVTTPCVCMCVYVCHTHISV